MRSRIESRGDPMAPLQEALSAGRPRRSEVVLVAPRNQLTRPGASPSFASSPPPVGGCAPPRGGAWRSSDANSPDRTGRSRCRARGERPGTRSSRRSTPRGEGRFLHCVPNQRRTTVASGRPNGREPMHRFAKGWHRHAVVGALLLTFTGVGFALASIPDADGVIHGCCRMSDGQLRVIDTDAGADLRCRREGDRMEQERSAGSTGSGRRPGHARRTRDGDRRAASSRVARHCSNGGVHGPSARSRNMGSGG